jgi:hypothetical protein
LLKEKGFLTSVVSELGFVFFFFFFLGLGVVAFFVERKDRAGEAGEEGGAAGEDCTGC